MSISKRLNVLNQTVQQLQQIIPDLFTKVILHLSTLSMMESVSTTTSTLLMKLSQKLSKSSISYEQVQQLQMEKFMAQQIYSEQHKNNIDHIDQYQCIFDSFNQNLYSKEGILLEKRGIKLSKKNKASMSQMQIKFQNDIKVSNMEYDKFQTMADSHYQTLLKHQKQLKQFRNKLKRRVQVLQWTVVNKSQQYYKYLNSNDELIQKQPISIQKQYYANTILKGNKQQKDLPNDLISMLFELRQQNKQQMQKLKEQRSYTDFLKEQFKELTEQLNNNSQKKLQQNQLTAIQRLERKCFLTNKNGSVHSL